MSSPEPVPLRNVPFLRDARDARKALADCVALSEQQDGQGLSSIIIVGAPWEPKDVLKLPIDRVWLATALTMLRRGQVPVKHDATLELDDLSHGADYQARRTQPKGDSLLILANVLNSAAVQKAVEEGRATDTYNPSAYARSVHDDGDAAWYKSIAARNHALILSFGAPDRYVTAEGFWRRDSTPAAYSKAENRAEWMNDCIRDAVRSVHYEDPSTINHVVQKNGLDLLTAMSSGFLGHQALMGSSHVALSAKPSLVVNKDFLNRHQSIRRPGLGL